jgi:hypothetical protein
MRCSHKNIECAATCQVACNGLNQRPLCPTSGHLHVKPSLITLNRSGKGVLSSNEAIVIFANQNGDTAHPHSRLVFPTPGPTRGKWRRWSRPTLCLFLLLLSHLLPILLPLPHQSLRTAPSHNLDEFDCWCGRLFPELEYRTIYIHT